MQEYIKIHNGKGANFSLDKWEELGITQDTFENLLRIFFGGWDDTWDMNMVHGRKWSKYYSGFDGSYGWESIMLDIFDMISPFLADGSELFIYPDNDYDHLIIKNEKCVIVH